MNCDFLRTADGLDLRVRAWEANGTARGQVVVVHGLGEHGGRTQPTRKHGQTDGNNLEAPSEESFGLCRSPSHAEAHLPR